MNELEIQIQKYYDDFSRDFNRDNFPAVFELIKQHNSKNNLKRQEHSLGSFAILYTPVRYKPEIMMIGNNPSWFDKDNVNYGKMCKTAVKQAKKEMKKQGEWKRFDWRKRDGYKCSSVSDHFRNDGKNICGKKNYMKHDKTGYLIFKIGEKPADVEKL